MIIIIMKEGGRVEKYEERGEKRRKDGSSGGREV